MNVGLEGVARCHIFFFFISVDVSKISSLKLSFLVIVTILHEVYIMIKQSYCHVIAMTTVSLFKNSNFFIK